MSATVEIIELYGLWYSDNEDPHTLYPTTTLVDDYGTLEAVLVQNGYHRTSSDLTGITFHNQAGNQRKIAFYTYEKETW